MKRAIKFTSSLLLTAGLLFLSCDDKIDPPSTAVKLAQGMVMDSVVAGAAAHHFGYLEYRVEDQAVQQAVWWSGADRITPVTGAEHSAFFAAAQIDGEPIGGGWLQDGISRVAFIYVKGEVLRLSKGSPDELVDALAVSADGKILAAGYKSLNGKRAPVVWRISRDHNGEFSTGSLIEESFPAASQSDTLLDGGIRDILLDGDRILYSGFVKEKSSEKYFAAIWESDSCYLLIDPTAPEGSSGGKRIPKASGESILASGTGQYLISGFIRKPDKKWQSAFWLVEKSSPSAPPASILQTEITDGTAASRSYCGLNASGSLKIGGYKMGPTDEWQAAYWNHDQTGTPVTLTEGITEAVLYALYIEDSELQGSGYCFGETDANLLQPRPALFHTDGSILFLDNSWPD